MPFCYLALKARRPKPNWRLYPKELNTLGDHIRKRRLDLGLTQRAVADRIGVDDLTVKNWENNHSGPRVGYMPAIINFLGYVPYKPPRSFSEWVRAFRTSVGLSQERLAAILGVDESTVAGWERGQHQPTEESLDSINTFLGSNARLWIKRSQ